MITVEKFITGPIETNTYVIVNDTKEAIVFDPSSGCEEVLEFLKSGSIVPHTIIITHGHFDHILGIPEIKSVYQDISVFIHPSEKMFLSKPDYNGSSMLGVPFIYTGKISELTEGEMEIEGFHFKVFLVPGHSPGGCAIYIDRYLICGDILFANSIGRSDLPGGNGELLVKGITEKLLVLPEDTVVCPGHGGRTTIGREKRTNPFL
jgi:hydroxyacylglutathione hydrolase